MSKNVSKQITKEMVDSSDRIILMTQKENLPEDLRNSEKIEFWNVPDAKDTSYEFHVTVFKEIEERVRRLIEEIG